jgi:cold-inducible RNA-binding protein
MNTKLYVGNLASTATEMDLQDLFSPHGNVAEINLPVKRASGRPRAFGVVTMATPQGARAALLALNGKELGARLLTVTEARPREEGAAPYPAERQGPAGKRVCEMHDARAALVQAATNLHH